MMTREQANNYLQSSGFSAEQIETIAKAYENSSYNSVKTELDCISRQVAIREYQKVCNGIKCGECPFLIKVNIEKESHLITDCKLEAFLYNLPSVSVAEKTGRWEKHSYFKDAYICSACNTGGNMVYKDFKYCPNCGAKMEEMK